MGEKNKDLDNLYLQCQGCANKYTSFECALCEDFDMYKEEYKEEYKEDKEVKEPNTITIIKSDDWQSIEVNGTKIENHKLDVDDFTDVLKELGFKVNVVWEDSDV